MGKLGDAEVVGGSYISERTGSGTVGRQPEKKQRRDLLCLVCSSLQCLLHPQAGPNGPTHGLSRQEAGMR